MASKLTKDGLILPDTGDYKQEKTVISVEGVEADNQGKIVLSSDQDKTLDERINLLEAGSGSGSGDVISGITHIDESEYGATKFLGKFAVNPIAGFGGNIQWYGPHITFTYANDYDNKISQWSRGDILDIVDDAGGGYTNIDGSYGATEAAFHIVSIDTTNRKIVLNRGSHTSFSQWPRWNAWIQVQNEKFFGEYVYLYDLEIPQSNNGNGSVTVTTNFYRVRNDFNYASTNEWGMAFETGSLPVDWTHIPSTATHLLLRTISKTEEPIKIYNRDISHRGYSEQLEDYELVYHNQGSSHTSDSDESAILWFHYPTNHYGNPQNETAIIDALNSTYPPANYSPLKRLILHTNDAEGSGGDTQFRSRGYLFIRNQSLPQWDFIGYIDDNFDWSLIEPSSSGSTTSSSSNVLVDEFWVAVDSDLKFINSSSSNDGWIIMYPIAYCSVGNSGSGNGTVTSVNNILPDSSGNVTIDVGNGAVSEVQPFTDISDKGSLTIGFLRDKKVYFARSDGGVGFGDQLNYKNLNPAANIPSFSEYSFPKDIKKFWICHSLGVFLTEDGELYTWGLNQYGECGHGNTTQIEEPTLVEDLGNNVVDFYPPTSYYSHWSSTSSIGLEEIRLFIKKNDGTIWGCGYNSNGALGLGDTTNRTSFTEITSAGTNPLSVWNLGQQAGCLVVQKSDFKILVSGLNRGGHLGDGTEGTGNKITTLTDLTSNWNNSGEDRFLVKAMGSFGREDYTSLLMAFSTSPDLTNSTATCFLRSCGDNRYGQLGLGNTTDITTPSTVNTTGSFKDLYYFGHYYGGVVLLNHSGNLYSWGYNGYGQVANGNFTHVYSPHLSESQVSRLLNVIQGPAGTGDASIFIEKSDGLVYSTGANHVGQLGQGFQYATGNSSGYRRVKLPYDVTVASIGCLTTNPNDQTVVCSTDDGSLFMWGYVTNHGASLYSLTDLQGHTPYRFYENSGGGSSSPTVASSYAHDVRSTTIATLQNSGYADDTNNSPQGVARIYDLNNLSGTTSTGERSISNRYGGSGTFDPNGGDIIVNVSYSGHNENSTGGGHIDQIEVAVVQDNVLGDKTKIVVWASNSDTTSNLLPCFINISAVQYGAPSDVYTKSEVDGLIKGTGEEPGNNYVHVESQTINVADGTTPLYTVGAWNVLTFDDLFPTLTENAVFLITCYALWIPVNAGHSVYFRNPHPNGISDNSTPYTNVIDPNDSAFLIRAPNGGGSMMFTMVAERSSGSSVAIKYWPTQGGGSHLTFTSSHCMKIG